MPASKDKVNTWKIVCKDNCILFNSWYMNNFSILQSSFSTYYSRIYYCTVFANIKCKQNSVPNRSAGPNKRAGGKILEKKINVQDRIDMQGGNFLKKH